MSATTDFLASVEDLKVTLDISPGKGDNTDRKRIAISVTDAFLICAGNDTQKIHHAPVLEWQLYIALAGLGLSCNPIPEEVRIEDNPKLRDWDALKMHSKPLDSLLAPCNLVNQVISLLTREVPRVNRTAEPERVHQLRSPHQALRNQPKRLAVVARSRPAVHPGWPEALFPRGVGRGLAVQAGKDHGRVKLSTEIEPDHNQITPNHNKIVGL